MRAMSRWLALILGAGALAGCSVLPEGASRGTADAGRLAGAAPQMSRTPGAGQCLAELGATRASFDPLPDRYFGNGCSNLNTVQLSALWSDDAQIAVADLGPVTCQVADTFEGWARYGVDRAARQYLGSGVRTIETFGSYSCRTVAGTSRLSAHARAAAIDVSGFVLDDGRRIMVASDWTGGSAPEREFLRVVAESACKRFDTVLSPDYNAAHHDHLHLEGVLDGKGFCR
jgi:hypothetical protein